MFKRILVILLMLLFVIGGLMGYQWFMYEKVIKAKMVQGEGLEIEASILHKDGKLTVNQKISNFKQASFLIEIPSNAISFKCFFPNEKECTIKEISPLHRLKVGNQSNVTFTYSIPVDRNVKSRWFENVLVQFLQDNQQGIKANYNVMLSEKEDRSLTWIAGAKTETKVEKENLSYFAWTNNDSPVFPLYMTKSPYQKVSKYEPNLIFYKLKDEDSNFNSFKNWIEKIPKTTSLSIVISNDVQTYLSPFLIVIPKSMNIKDIEELVIKSYLLNLKPPKDNKIEWLWNVFPLFILDRPVGEGKEYEMSKDLVDNLQLETRHIFADWLLNPNLKGEKVSTNKLDDQLSSASKLKTTFFTINKDINKQIIPLYYLDSREVFYQDKHINYDWNAIERNKNLLFPFVQTMEGLGFEVEFFPEINMFLITKDENNWNFYSNKTSYSLNKKEYSVKNRPLELIGNEMFISEQSLEGIFNMDVIKRDGWIFLE